MSEKALYGIKVGRFLKKLLHTSRKVSKQKTSNDEFLSSPMSREPQIQFEMVYRNIMHQQKQQQENTVGITWSQGVWENGVVLLCE